jgi:hypothetical protein
VTLVAGRFQLLDAARPDGSQRARDLQTAQTVRLRDVHVQGVEALVQANAVKGIFHPSLVTLFDVVPHEPDRVLLAYEFVPAQSIAQMTGGQSLHPKRAAEIVIEIADALAELHARGMWHGGVSQSTVLITMKGKAKLDRIGDPTLTAAIHPSIALDLIALGKLLDELSGRPSGGSGVAGIQAIEAIIQRACAGRFDSAATMAALLRRL